MRYKNKKLVDAVSGKLTLVQLNREIAQYMLQKKPTLLLITIERDDTIKGYRSTIYLTLEDFKKSPQYDSRVMMEEFAKWRKETQLFANND